MWWISAAVAGTDLSVTSIGADAVRSEAIDDQDVDLLVGQRLRWHLSPASRLLFDGRFAIDPNADTTWEESRLREAGVAIETDQSTILAGRHPVMFGGPRLADGVQAVALPGAWTLGGWAGLIPDEFTTAPTLRYGGGPIVAYTRTGGSLSAVGDLVLGDDGLQRLGVLAQARGEVGRTFQTTGRLDWLFDDGNGSSGLADGAVFVQVRPTGALRFDAIYDAYSSLLYQSRSDLDPRIQRFADRLEELGLQAGISQDQVDSTLHHLIGATARVRGVGDVQPLAMVRARTQLSPEDDARYTRVGGLLGIAGLAGDRLELGVDGNLLWIGGGTGGDVGITAMVNPDPDGVLAIDGSARVLFDPSFAGTPGGYADLFADLLSRRGTTFAAGASWTGEPSDLLGTDVGIAAFLRLQQWVRPDRTRLPVSP